MTDPLRDTISATARWIALYRMRESQRSDACFHDPYAVRFLSAEDLRTPLLAGPAGSEWAMVARTAVIDELVQRCVADGASVVLNLAAGLDTRPYRLDLPASLRWVEVDLPAVIAEKEAVLATDVPRCRLERVALDLADIQARRALFAALDGSKVLVLTEGLTIYLQPDAVEAVAADLRAQPAFCWWITDLVSPRTLTALQQAHGRTLAALDAPMRFAPAEGPAWFAAVGWPPIEVRSYLQEAARLRRVPLHLRLIAWLLPDSKGVRPPGLWGGVCLLGRAP